MEPLLGHHIIVSRRDPSSDEELWTLLRQVIVFQPKRVMSRTRFARIRCRTFKHLARRKRLMNPCCSVCTEPFEGDHRLKVLRCGHAFHPSCIEPWLCEQATTCPVCRDDQEGGGSADRAPA